MVEKQVYITAFAAHLRNLRHERNMSQQLLADEAGLDLKTVQRIEAGKLNPTLITLISLTFGLDIPLQKLVDFPLNQ